MLRPFIIRCAAFAVIWTGILAAALQIPNPMLANQSLFAAIHDKHALLQQTPSPKFVLLGGSNVVFGISSPDLERHLGRPVINAGLHARLGLKFMLDDVASHLHPGDVLVVMPEYEQFTDFFYGQRELVAVLVDVRPESRHHVSIRHGLMISGYVPIHAASKLLHARWRNGRIEVRYANPGVYQRSNFNRHGDVDAHWTSPPKPFPVAQGNPSFRIDRSAVDYLQQYCEKLRGRGVRVVLVPPGLQEASFDNLENMIAEIERQLAEAGIPFWADPDRYRVANEHCFDSPYHLTKDGVDDRTFKLAEDLQRLLDSAEPVPNGGPDDRD